MLSSLSFHKDFQALRFATHEIGIVKAAFSHTLSAQALSALMFEPHNQAFSWQATHDTVVTGEIERENDHCFKVRMQADLRLKTTCGRCLGPLQKTFALDFVIRMMEKEHLGIIDHHEIVGKDGSIEIDMSKDDNEIVGYFCGTCIDLGIILRDQIFLEVPDYAQCDGAHCSLPVTSISGVNALDRDNEHGNNPFVKYFKKT